MKKITNNALTAYTVVAVFSIIVLLVLPFISNCLLSSGQERITRIYERETEINDSIQQSHIETINESLLKEEQTIKAALSDSAINQIPKLTKQQRKTLKYFVRPFIETCFKERKDCLHLSTLNNENANKDELKVLLELEFNKIQNEYESLELWGALITIVFLIFSFYSLFKSEKFEKEAQTIIEKLEKVFDEATDRLKDNKKETSALIEKIEQQTLSDSKAFKEELTTLKKSYEKKLETVLNNATKRVDQNSNIIESYKQQLDDLMDEYQTKFSLLEESLGEHIDNTNEGGQDA